MVKENEVVSRGSVLVEGKKEGERETFSLAQIFKISPDQIGKVLVKNLGDNLKKGEVLAKKEGIFGKVVLRSPIAGRITQISQVLGEVSLVREGKKVVIKSPVPGKVKKISEDKIKIDFLGVVFKGIKGGGGQSLGVIENLPAGVGVLDLPTQVAQKILVSPQFSSPVLAKAWALEAAGVVGLNFSSKDPPLPFLIVDKKDLEALRNYQGKRIVLEPEEKRLIVLFE